MKKVSIFLVMLVSILTFSFNNDVQAQSGRRIIVDATTSINSGLSFSTIKKAVDSALSGDTVIVKEGTYKEKIRVNNKLVLASEFLLDGNRAHIANTIITGDSLAQNSLSDALIYSTVGGDTSTFKLIGLTVTKAARSLEYYNNIFWMKNTILITLNCVGTHNHTCSICGAAYITY
jgi:pectin methylesterase-like acyl-CoA thioesterase